MQGDLSHLIGNEYNVVCQELKVKPDATLHVQVAHKLFLAALTKPGDSSAEGHYT